MVYEVDTAFNFSDSYNFGLFRNAIAAGATALSLANLGNFTGDIMSKAKAPEPNLIQNGKMIIQKINPIEYEQTQNKLNRSLDDYIESRTQLRKHPSVAGYFGNAVKGYKTVPAYVEAVSNTNFRKGVEFMKNESKGKKKK